MPAKSTSKSTASKAKKETETKEKQPSVLQTRLDELTASVIVAMEKGDFGKWMKTWSDSTVTIGINFASKHQYSGSNAFITAWMAASQERPNIWGTYNGGNSMGWQLRKGSKQIPLLRPQQINIEADPDTNKKAASFVRYNVFGVANLLDFDAGSNAKLSPQEYLQDLEKELTANALPESQRIPHAEKFFKVAHKAMGLSTAKGSPAYSPQVDKLFMPEFKHFQTPTEYYGTLGHETIHSSGHAERLGRKGITEFDHFGSKQYAFEELIAELGSVFLLNHLNLDYNLLHKTAYIASWIEGLKENPQYLWKASAQAQKAYGYVREQAGEAIPERPAYKEDK